MNGCMSSATQPSPPRPRPIIEAPAPQPHSTTTSPLTEPSLPLPAPASPPPPPLTSSARALDLPHPTTSSASFCLHGITRTRHTYTTDLCNKSVAAASISCTTVGFDEPRSALTTARRYWLLPSTKTDTGEFVVASSSSSAARRSAVPAGR